MSLDLSHSREAIELLLETIFTTLRDPKKSYGQRFHTVLCGIFELECELAKVWCSQHTFREKNKLLKQAINSLIQLNRAVQNDLTFNVDDYKQFLAESQNIISERVFESPCYRVISQFTIYLQSKQSWLELYHAYQKRQSVLKTYLYYGLSTSIELKAQKQFIKLMQNLERQHDFDQRFTLDEIDATLKPILHSGTVCDIKEGIKYYWDNSIDHYNVTLDQFLTEEKFLRFIEAYKNFYKTVNNKYLTNKHLKEILDKKFSLSQDTLIKKTSPIPLSEIKYMREENISVVQYIEQSDIFDNEISFRENKDESFIRVQKQYAVDFISNASQNLLVLYDRNKKNKEIACILSSALQEELALGETQLKATNSSNIYYSKIAAILEDKNYATFQVYEDKFEQATLLLGGGNSCTDITGDYLRACSSYENKKITQEQKVKDISRSLFNMLCNTEKSYRQQFIDGLTKKQNSALLDTSSPKR